MAVDGAGDTGAASDDSENGADDATLKHKRPASKAAAGTDAADADSDADEVAAPVSSKRRKNGQGKDSVPLSVGRKRKPGKRTFPKRPAIVPAVGEDGEEEDSAAIQGHNAPSHRVFVSAARKACSRRLRDMMKLLAKFQNAAVSVVFCFTWVLGRGFFS